MHDTAAKYGSLFLSQYRLPNEKNQLLVEVGTGPDLTFVNICNQLGIEYKGFDQLHSDNPDEKYHLDLPDNHADFVISSSCFEHDEFFWVTYLEILRILKPSGLFYLNAPSNGPYHAFPGDCYRFYRDSAKALEKWGRKNGYNVKTIEHFIGKPMRDQSQWMDYVAVWVKDEQFLSLYPKRIQDVDFHLEQGWRI